MRKRGGTVLDFESVARAKDGTEIPVLISASFLYDEKGRRSGPSASRPICDSANARNWRSSRHKLSSKSASRPAPPS